MSRAVHVAPNMDFGLVSIGESSLIIKGSEIIKRVIRTRQDERIDQVSAISFRRRGLQSGGYGRKIVHESVGVAIQ